MLTTTAANSAKRNVGISLQHMPACKVSLAPQTRHLLAIHVGKPVRAACRLAGGPLQRRLQMPGDIDVVPAGCTGEWEDEAPCSILTISLSQDLVAATAARMDIDLSVRGIRPQLQLRDKSIEHLAWALQAQHRTATAAAAIYLESLGTALAAHLLGSSVPERVDNAAAQAGKLRQLPAPGLQRVLVHIENNLDTDLSLAELAAIAGLSVSHFKMRFKTATGIAAHRYVMRRRVEFAAELIQGGQPLSQVALQAGFTHQSHMARSMRQLLGLAPGELQRRISVK
ncbi:helix-turn-helix domain-containing protein [Undibacterium terreum]|uniref:AraC family transcriptional regulator n=1 Tax=Undibacterium terreum TaxID=1224302 RepID=A0A916XQA1_9BURK|nr:AraC family transcriptional regulator [Undibacterium terreum]GGC95685.1 AraC family transcriptional regulator [Undibacterium terreum]